MLLKLKKFIFYIIVWISNFEFRLLWLFTFYSLSYSCLLASMLTSTARIPSKYATISNVLLQTWAASSTEGIIFVSLIIGNCCVNVLFIFVSFIHDTCIKRQCHTNSLVNWVWFRRLKHCIALWEFSARLCTKREFVQQYRCSLPALTEKWISREHFGNTLDRLKLSNGSFRTNCWFHQHYVLWFFVVSISLFTKIQCQCNGSICQEPAEELQVILGGSVRLVAVGP